MDLPPDVCSHDDDVNQWLPDVGPYSHSFFESVDDDDNLAHTVNVSAWQVKYSLPSSREVLTQKDVESFQTHVERWRSDTLILSSTRQITGHSSYKKIIDLGRKVLPLVLTELRDRPSYWFTALEELAPEGPRGPFHNFNEQRHAWLMWGMQRGELERLQPAIVSTFSKAHPKKSQTKKSIRPKL